MTNVKKALEDFGKDIAKDIAAGKPPSMEVPVRSLSNVRFNKIEGTLELGEKTSQRAFFNIAHAKKFLQMIEVAAICKNLVVAGKHTNLRDVFYMARRTIPGTKTDVVDDQSETDKALEDLELITGMPREQLHVNAAKSGSVAGNVIIEDRGDEIDWSKMGSGGWSIPSNVEEIKFKKVKAKYIIYMEKDAVWERLHEDKYWDKHNCIIMSSRGQATRGIRRLLQRLADEHNVMIYVLTDFDPWGFYIYSVLKYGSINLAHMSGRMTIKNARFLGVMGEDIVKYELKKFFFKFTDVDKNRLKQISEYEWFKDHKGWKKQFKMMKDFSAKVEINALSNKDISFISEKYLPEKIKSGEFLD